MSQASNWGVPSVGPATPTVMSTRMNDSFNALLSQHKGASRPSYATAGTEWIDDSGTPWVRYLFDGTQDIFLGVINGTSHWEVNAGSALDVRQFGATGDGETDDYDAIEAAIEAAAGSDQVVYFPPGVYRHSQAIKLKSDLKMLFSGIDVTIFKLTDDAAEGLNNFQPEVYDGSVRNVVLCGGFTVDNNYSRPAVSGVGDSNRPGNSCFVTAGMKYLYIVGGIKVVDGALHGLDICNGGEDNAGNLSYVAPGNASNTYYPANESRYIFIDRVIAANCGDDGVTVHYSRDIFIDEVYVASAGDRHPNTVASNCFELDDGSRNVYIDRIVVRGGNRGVAIKCHDSEPPPFDVNIGSIYAEGCGNGLAVYSDTTIPGARVNISSVIVKQPDNSYETTFIRGIEIQNMTDVNVGQAIVEAEGDEAFTLHQGIIVSSGAKRVNIGAAIVKNWPYNQTSDVTISGVRVTSSCEDVTFGSASIHNCGLGGFTDGGSLRLKVGSVTCVGDNIASSVGLSYGANPFSRGSYIGHTNISDYVTPVIINSVSNANSASFHSGELILQRLLVGRFTADNGVTEGFEFQPGEPARIAHNTAAASFNRIASDGGVIVIQRAGVDEGVISVAAGVVTYGSFSGSHWSQFANNDRLAVLPGTLLETIDELCVWKRDEWVDPETGKKQFVYYVGELNDGDTYTDNQGVVHTIVEEVNERLARCKISDTAGSARVYGGFLHYDDDEKHGNPMNDFMVIGVGAAWVRVGANEEISGGDLVESAGDGTARKQADQTKIGPNTVAKITASIPLKVYEDGSKLMPCVYYCG